jgi:hypothetical protein
MSDELNMEAERAEFEAWASKSGPHITLCHVFSFSPDVNGGRYHDGTTELCWRAWLAARRTVDTSVDTTAHVSAPMGKGIEDIPLPPLPMTKAQYGLDHTLSFSAIDMRNYGREAIAPYAERIRQLERELAERKTASIDTPEFRNLLLDYSFGNYEDDTDVAAALITYIDNFKNN